MQQSFGMIFPGQGSQFLGMLSDFEKNNTEIQKTFFEASNILGYDLWDLIQNGPIEELNKTWKTQPALLASSVAIYRIWIKKFGLVPKIMAGHSLGLYSALVCSGVLDFVQTIKLVALRGKLMQEAMPEGSGAMTVIFGLKRSTILKICKDISNKEIVEAANFNAPNQTVISGHKKAVAQASMICKSMGAKRIFSLPISIPSHCILMKSSAKKFSLALEKIHFKLPEVPVINNVNKKCEIFSKNIKKALIKQIYSPVYWIDSINFIMQKNIKILLEIGPGKILTNLAKYNVKNLTVMAINNPSSFLKVMQLW